MNNYIYIYICIYIYIYGERDDINMGWQEVKLQLFRNSFARPSQLFRNSDLSALADALNCIATIAPRCRAGAAHHHDVVPQMLFKEWRKTCVPSAM